MTTSQFLTLRAREGNPASGVGAGVIYQDFKAPQFSNSGGIGFQVKLKSDGSIANIASTADDAYYHSPAPGIAPQLVIREGNTAPDTEAGTTVKSFSSVSLSNNDTIAALFSLQGSSVTTANDFAIYAGAPDDLRMIAREGVNLPENFGALGLVTNGLGQLAFVGQQTVQVTSSTTNVIDMLYATQTDGTLLKLLEEGDAFDIGGSNLQTIQSITLLGSTESVSGSQTSAGFQGNGYDSFNDDGVLVFKLGFGGFSEGIFTARVPVVAIPEPNLAVLLGGLLCGFGCKRRRSKLCRTLI